MKNCTKCNVIKELCEFSGISSQCRSCKNEWQRMHYIANKEKYKLRNQTYCKEKRTNICKKWYIKNKEVYLEKCREYYRNNPHKAAEKCSRRQKRILQAKLPQFDSILRSIYKNCPTGYEVDHIIPLKGKEVCGLHVPWNLQYLTKSQNRSKSNKIIA